MKIGDKVRIIKNNSSCEFYDKYIGRTVEVTQIKPNHNWDLEVDMGGGELECIDLCEVEEVINAND